MPGGSEAREPRRRQSESVEVVPLRGGSHRSGALAGGEADHPPFRYGAQMRRKHHVGVGGGDRGIEDGAQERASVAHGSLGIRESKILKQLIHPIASKENPRSIVRGFSF